MKVRYAATILAVGFCALIGVDSAEARNRTSLIGNAKKAFAARKAHKSRPEVPRIPPPQPQVHPVPFPMPPAPHSVPNHGLPNQAQRMLPPQEPVAKRGRRGQASPAVAEIRRRAEKISRGGLDYKFGGGSPSEAEWIAPAP